MSSGVCHRWLNSCRGRTQSCPLLPLKNAGFSWQKWWFTQQRCDVTFKNCRNLSSKRTYDQTLMFVGKLIHPLVVMQNLPSCVGHHIRRKQDFHIRVGLLAGNHQWGSILYIYTYMYREIRSRRVLNPRSEVMRAWKKGRNPAKHIQHHWIQYKHAKITPLTI